MRPFLTLFSLFLLLSIAHAEPQRIVLEDWAALLKQDTALGNLFRSTQADWPSLEKSKTWKELNKQNDELVKMIQGLHDSTETSWLKGELQNEERLNTLMKVVQFDLLQARHFVVQKKFEEASKVWGFWLKASQSVVNSEGGVVGLRLAVLIRSLIFDDVERELRNPKSQWQDAHSLLDKFRHIQSLWPVDKLVKNTLAEFQLQVASEATKLDSVKYFQKFYGNASPRMQELLREHSSVIVVEDILTDTNHYTQYMVELFKSNPYSPSSNAIEKVQKEMWARLTGEAGNSSFILENITRLDVGDRSKLIKLADLDSMSKDEFKRVKKHFKNTPNPLGRLLAVEYLFHLSQIWRDYDVGSMKTELSRAAWIQGMLAIRTYKAQHKQNPKSMEELVSQQLLTEIPMNYYISQPLKYSPKVGRLDLVTVQ